MKIFVTLPLLTAWAPSAWAPSAYAKSAKDSHDNKDKQDIVGSSAVIAKSQDETLASVTIIKRRKIENSQTQTHADLLSSFNGLSISNNGGLDRLTSLFPGLANSGHVLFFINGIRVSSATTGSTTFEPIPLEAINLIETIGGWRTRLDA